MLKLMICVTLLLYFIQISNISCCNEAVCAPIVSKCMLTQSCKCDFKTNVTCSRGCYHCLDYLYSECCSCVEMCPKPNETDTSLSSKSHVEDLLEPHPDLFNLLTEEDDRLLRWKSFTIPVEIKFLTEIHNKDIKYTTKVIKSDSDGIDQEEDIPVNCTVAFMSQCMSWNKCKSSCRSMGANSYRWFHDGCCECVGSYCVNYGINQSKCLQCPLVIETDDDVPIDEGHSHIGAEDNRHDYDFEESVRRGDEDDDRAQNAVNNNEDKVNVNVNVNVNNNKQQQPKEEIPEKKTAEENAVPKNQIYKY